MNDGITFLLIDSLYMTNISLHTNSRTWEHTDKKGLQNICLNCCPDICHML